MNLSKDSFITVQAAGREPLEIHISDAIAVYDEIKRRNYRKEIETVLEENYLFWDDSTGKSYDLWHDGNAFEPTPDEYEKFIEKAVEEYAWWAGDTNAAIESAHKQIIERRKENEE